MSEKTVIHNFLRTRARRAKERWTKNTTQRSLMPDAGVS
jgi:hypothetical protein